MTVSIDEKSRTVAGPPPAMMSGSSGNTSRSAPRLPASAIAATAEIRSGNSAAAISARPRPIRKRSAKKGSNTERPARLLRGLASPCQKNMPNTLGRFN